MAESIPALFLDAVDRDPDRTAMFWREGGSWRSMTWGGCLQETARIAAGLRARGVGEGTKVAILSETRREWTAIDMATLTLGGVTVGIYPSLLPDQVAYQLAHGEVKVLVVEDASQAAKIEAVRDRLPDLEHVLSIEPVEGLEGVHDLPADPDVAAFRADAARRGPDDVATLIYTSGTTGNPKGAILTHGAFVRVAHASRVAPRMQPGDRALVFLPLAHSLQRFAVYRGLLEDVVGYYVESIEALPDAIAFARPTVMSTVPRMLEKMVARADAKVRERGGVVERLYDWSFGVGRQRALHLERGEPVPATLALQHRLADRLVFRRVRERLGGGLRVVVSGGAALDPEVARWFLAMDIAVLEGWGLTETCAPATANTEERFKLGTVGRPLPGVEVRVAEDGELLVRGPGLFRGYYKDPEATEAAFVDGWFRTGDIGTVDPDGFVAITDRKKEIIVTAGGKNIPPVDIEQRLERSAVVEKAMVLGDGRAYLVALLTPDVEALGALASRNGWPAEDLEARIRRPEVQALFDAAVSEANATLARFEQVKKHRVLPATFSVASGEMTPTLKLKRRVVAERWGEVIEGMYR